MIVNGRPRVTPRKQVNPGVYDADRRRDPSPIHTISGGCGRRKDIMPHPMADRRHNLARRCSRCLGRC